MGSSTPCPRRCCASRARARPTRTRAPRHGASTWWIPTIAGRWTTRGSGPCSTISGARRPRPGLPRGKLARELLAAKEDGRVKLYLTSRALRCRRDHPGLFSTGDYLPLTPTGEQAAHCFAFARNAGDAWAIAAVPRLLTRLLPEPPQAPLGPEVWGDTRLPLPAIPTMRWTNLFTGERLDPAMRDGVDALAAGDVFRDFPVALLLAQAR